MKHWSVAARLNALKATAVLAMAAVIGMNWYQASVTRALELETQKRIADAGELKDGANLGAQLYRVVADTYINAHFEEAAASWAQESKTANQFMGRMSQLADTNQEREWAQNAQQAMQQIQRLYEQKFLPMVKGGAALEDVREVDEQMDQLIDKYDEQVSRIAESMLAEAQEAQKVFDDAQAWNLRVSIVVALVAAGVLIGFGLAISRGIRQDLGAEPREVRAVLSALRDGDLTVAVPRAAGDQASVMAAVEDMRNRLRDVIQTVRQGSDSIQLAAAEVAMGNQDLSSRTEAAASNLEQTAASMEEITATVKQSADSARQANQLASTAAAVAVKGGDVVGTMQDIQQSSKKIADIIGVIDGIAFQTNILALNAAVEAARAGEQGRGFAVVAGEVRNLAQRSAQAAKEIKDLIGASVEKVESGSALVADAGHTMGEIVASVQRVNDIIAGISAAAGEQNNGIAQVNVAVTQLDQMTQQNAALVEESAAAAQSLRDQANRLSEAVGVFRVSASDRSAPDSARLAAASTAVRALPHTRG
ncbi:MAG: methyl-accepting chemotaxis protein [Burkholderiaceae bacterium]